MTTTTRRRRTTTKAPVGPSSDTLATRMIFLPPSSFTSALEQNAASPMMQSGFGHWVASFS